MRSLCRSDLPIVFVYLIFKPSPCFQPAGPKVLYITFCYLALISSMNSHIAKQPLEFTPPKIHQMVSRKHRGRIHAASDAPGLHADADARALTP